MTQSITAGRTSRLFPLLAFGLPLACLIWAFWTTLTEIAHIWSTDASYSHGWLVPVFAVALLWFRRDSMPDELVTPSWWGAVLLVAGIALRLVASYFFYVSLDPLALIPCVMGICLLVGGWKTFRWAWPALLFLTFMVPLPWGISHAMAGQLQTFATIVSTFLLQTLGLPALAEGNVILLSKVEMGIVEACSGLRMLVVFFALSTAVALLMQRAWWERVVVILSAVPIALATNVMRITATGVLHELVSSDMANAVFHDFAGWMMPFMGLALLGLELKLLQFVMTEPSAVMEVSPPIVASEAPKTTQPAEPVATRGRRPWQPARGSRQGMGFRPSTSES